jgi:hypothetical protein
MMELRRKMRSWKVELLRCLGEPSELRNGSIRVSPIDFESGAFRVGSDACASLGKELGKIGYALRFLAWAAGVASFGQS